MNFYGPDPRDDRAIRPVPPEACRELPLLFLRLDLNLPGKYVPAPDFNQAQPVRLG